MSSNASVPEIVAQIHAHLLEVVPDYVAPPPAPAEALSAIEQADLSLPSELLEFYRIGDGIELPVEVPELVSLLTASEALEETRRANEHGDDVAPIVVLEHQDFEGDVYAMVVSGELRGQIVRWDSVERYFDEDDAEPFLEFLTKYLTTLTNNLPTPKTIKAAVASIAEAGRAGEWLADRFEKFSLPAVILQAVLEGEADAPSWVSTRYQELALARPLRANFHELPLELLIATAGKLAFAGTTTLLDGHEPLADTLLAYAYVRDPETTLREADKLQGSAKDGWLLMRRRMGLVAVNAISPALRARVVATPRKYSVQTPRNGRVEESPATGVEGLEPYFESREELLAAVRNAPAAAATTGDMLDIMLGDTPTAARVAALAEAVGASASYGDVPDATWHRVPLNVLIEAAPRIKDRWCADWFGWACVTHPSATPERLDALVGQLDMPSDTTLLERLSEAAVETIKAKSA